MSSFWKLFRVVFVISCLYLVGDAFYRWDGFRLYASISEFVPSVSLILILWSIVALFATIFIWIAFTTFQFLCRRIGWNFTAEHVILFICAYLLITAAFRVNSELKILYNLKIIFRQSTDFIRDSIGHYTLFSEHALNILAVLVLTSIIIIFSACLLLLLVRLAGSKGWKNQFKSLVLLGIVAGLIIFIYYASETGWRRLIGQTFIIYLAFSLLWTFRDKAGRWGNVLQDRITPLVWLFGMSLIFSVPLLSYHTWFKSSDHPVKAAPAHSSEAGHKKPNIILVIFDTLTARDMPLYGYDRQTTPFIDMWAQEASVFTRAKSDSNCTTPSVASLMTGKRVWTHGTYRVDGAVPLKSDIENLPLLLKNNGYVNMAFIVNWHASPSLLGISESFHIAPPSTDFAVRPVSLIGRYGAIKYYLYGLFGNKIRLWDWIMKKDFLFKNFLRMISSDFTVTAVPPEKAFKSFLDAVSDSPGNPFFAWIQIMPPHDPYLPPEPYMGMFNDSPHNRSFKKKHSGVGREENLHIMRARYDEFIRYCDSRFKEFISAVNERGISDNTIIVMTSDHGESFEHDYIGHAGPHLYEQVTHIPLVIKEPGQKQQKILGPLVSLIDIAPTILELSHIEVPEWMEGRSLVPLLRGQPFSEGPVYAAALEANPSGNHEIALGTVAVWEDDYKLIHYVDNNETLLFDLKNDPGEMKDLAALKPDITHRMLSFISDSLQETNRSKHENSLLASE